MRFMIGLFCGGACAFAAGLLAWPEAEADPGHAAAARAYADALEDLHAEAARRHAAERRALLWETWYAIASERLRELGRPQTWAGPTVSAPVRVPPPEELGILPERIPAPAVPLPTRPKEQ